MYEDPNVTERAITVVFTYASDDDNDPAMRGEIVEEITDLATRLGMEAEIHAERMID